MVKDLERKDTFNIIWIDNLIFLHIRESLRKNGAELFALKFRINMFPKYT